MSEFRKNNQPERKFSGKKKRFKHFDIFHGPLKIPGYAVRFCTGNFWKFKPEFLVKWKALLITVTMNVGL